MVSEIVRSGRLAAAHKFDVDEKYVRCWCTQMHDLAEATRTRKALRGTKCKLPKLGEDLFAGHLTDREKARLAYCRMDSAVIPGGLTGVLHLCINRPFNAEFQRCYTETPTGRLKRASLQQVCIWIMGAWRSFSVDTIAKSFQVTGLSNAMDGTTEDQLWERADEVSSSDSGESAVELNSSDSD
ncbi:hypothetical protein HPB52_015824 [Rhipicephalus sanguineus]|uniref:DDE-1 domain-containing protein n=1 Tax=Rhipicephalus sanguineus TaxID=34632 RepID=A0A9D4QE01_RHISA|nr:hypothetical protein HPB52_015824 [Rhipicephalus sanguineus]